LGLILHLDNTPSRLGVYHTISLKHNASGSQRKGPEGFTSRLCYTQYVTFKQPVLDEEVAPTGAEELSEVDPRQRWIVAGGVLVMILLVAGAIGAAVLLVANPQQTETLRDVFIIFMALEFLVIGLALIILIVQLARLTALIQNEVQPILESTNDTVRTLRGTTSFLSKNLVEPVVRANSSMAAIRRAINIIRPGGRR